MKNLKYKKKYIIEGYKKGAVNYDQERMPWNGCLGKIEKEKISMFLNENSILECGVGTGRHALNFGNKYAYVGIDISLDMIKICLEKTKNMDVDVDLVLSDAECLAFRNDVFDNLLCSKSFKFFNSPLKFLHGAKSSLKKGGRCMITVEVLDSIWFRLVEKLGWKVPRHEKHYFINEGISFFKIAGFSNLRIEPIANLLLGIHLFLWYILYPTPFNRIFHYKSSSLNKILLKIDKRLRSRFLVLFMGEV